MAEEYFEKMALVARNSSMVSIARITITMFVEG
jgi:hypothetical protein